MNKSKRRIALVTTWFPPKNGIAVNRMLSFAQHLSGEYEVEVFALDDRKHQETQLGYRVHYNTESKLVRILKSDTRDGKFLHNLKTLARIIVLKVVKNPLQRWKKQTLADLQKVHSSHPFDLVISSYAPKEAHQVVLEFKETNPGIPWIADMRDDMSTNPYNLPYLNENLRKLEAKIAEKATAITSISERITDGFKVTCPGVKYYQEIRNGFNHTVVVPEYVYAEKRVFQLGHFGSFYGPIKPGIFLDALSILKQREPAFEFHLELVGAHRNFSIPESISDNVDIVPLVPYETAITMMTKVDGLVLIAPGSKRMGVFTGKLFDYLSARRSILALLDPTDVAADLIRETHAGYIGECNDLEENIRVISQAWNDWRNKKMRIISAEDAQLNHRKYQSDKLKVLIQKILGE